MTKKPWKPKRGQPYYYFNDRLEIINESYDPKKWWDFERVNMGNCFKTMDEVELVRDSILDALK